MTALIGSADCASARLAAAEFAGVTPGAPAEVYEPATPLDLKAPLLIEPAAARLLAQWYSLGARPHLPPDWHRSGGGGVLP